MVPAPEVGAQTTCPRIPDWTELQNPSSWAPGPGGGGAVSDPHLFRSKGGLLPGVCGVSKKVCYSKSYKTGTRVTIPTLQGGKLRQGEGAILSRVSQELGRGGAGRGSNPGLYLQGRC